MKAWKKSGETATVFAASRGIEPRTLTWWKWRLSHRADPLPVAEPTEMRLVGVAVEPPPTTMESTPAWELVTAGGDVLRVYSGTSSTELISVVQAIVSGGQR